jgi:hypothetical protein
MNPPELGLAFGFLESASASATTALRLLKMKTPVTPLEDAVETCHGHGQTEMLGSRGQLGL